MNKTTIAMTVLNRISELPKDFDPVTNKEHQNVLEELKAAANEVITRSVDDGISKQQVLRSLFVTSNAFTIDGPVLISRKGKNQVTQIAVSNDGVLFNWREGTILYESYFPTEELSAAVLAGNEWTILDNKGNPHRFGFFSLYRNLIGTSDPLINQGGGEYVLSGSECTIIANGSVLHLVSEETEVTVGCSVMGSQGSSSIGTLRMSLPSPSDNIL